MHESGTSNFNQPFDTINYNNRIQQPPSCSPNVAAYCYDAAGDLLNDGFHVYAYDGESRIKSVDGNAAAYTYNPLGNRVRKDTSTNGSTEYFFFGGNIIAELNPATTTWTDYIFGYGKRLAKDTSSNGSSAQYYQEDHLASTRIMTNASGTVISECSYGPYGEQISCSPDNASNHYRFTGKERDTESGLDYFGARYYSNGLGRFITPDWAAKATAVPYADFGDPQSLNLYGYVRGNPLSHVDLDGHQCDTCQKVWNWLTSSHSASATSSVAASQSTDKSGPLSVTASIGTAQASASASYGKNTSASAGVSAAVASTTINEGSHSTTQMSALSGDAKLSAGLSTGGKTGTGISASASANANVFSASQTETVTIGPVEITGSATGNVGLGASASLSAGTNGISASAGITPGYGGALSLSINWSGVSASGGASVQGTADKTTTTINKPEIKTQ